VTDPRKTAEIPVLEMLHRKVERAKPHVKPFLFMIGLMLVLYFASATTPPGWLTFALSAVALMLIGITALARLNDLSSDLTSKRWQVRRVGLIMVGASAVGLLFEPLIVYFNGHPMLDFPTWREVMLRWGMTLVWITTPHMPPWWRYVSGQYRTLREERAARASTEIAGLYPEQRAPQYAQAETLPPEVAVERRHGYDRREHGGP
jgi:hypothetical protein